MYALDGALSRYPLLHGFLARRELAQDFPAVTTRPHTAGWPSSHLSQALCLCPRLIRFRASVAASVLAHRRRHRTHSTQPMPKSDRQNSAPHPRCQHLSWRHQVVLSRAKRAFQHTGATGMAHQPRKLTVAHWHSRKQCAASQKPVPQRRGPWMTSFSP